jgi:hypothetical protein
MWECVCDVSLLWWLPYPGWFQDAAPSGCQILAGSRMPPATGQVIVGVAAVSVTGACYKHRSVSNGLHSESLLQKCPQCNGQCKSPLPVLTGRPQDLARASRYRRRRLKASVSFNIEKADACRNRCFSFRRDSGDLGSRNASLKLIHSNRLYFMPVTKVPCGPRETTISRDRWLVVVTVVVWCLLRILYVLKRAWNRRVSVRQDSGDAGAHLASLILSYCNGLCFGAH